MPTQPEYTALPLEQFIIQLQAAGFHIDTGRKLRMLRLLKLKGGEHIGRFTELKYTLAPFVASSPAEQQRFYEFFDAFIEDCTWEMQQWVEQFSLENPPLPEVTLSSVEKNRRLWRRFGWIGLAIVLATGAFFVIKKWLEPRSLRIEKGLYLTPSAGNRYPFLREGQRHQFASQPANADTTQYVWELRDTMSGVVEQRDTGRYFDYIAEGYGRDKWVILRGPRRRTDTLLLHIHCADPPPMPEWIMPEVPALEGKSYEFGLALPYPDSVVQWIFNSRDILRGTKVSYTFTETGEATVECKVFRDSNDCYSWEQRRFNIIPDIPWIWFLYTISLLAAIWFLRRRILTTFRFLQRWWQQCREKFVPKITKKPEQDSGDEHPINDKFPTTDAYTTNAIVVSEHPIYDKAPYFIPYLPPDGKISTPPDFFRMAELLHRRKVNEHRELDIPASVRATVDGGGFPTLLDKRSTTPPDYLFLIERVSAQDQKGRLFERVSTFFLKQDAPLSAYFHDGSFRGFWNDAHPQGVSFEFLQKQHSDCRLVLIGTGHGLLDPRNTREPALLRAQLDPLLRWKKALFLSTLPVSGWFAPEVLLHRHFLLYPADAEGIRAGLEALDALEEHEPAPFTKWESALASRRNDRNPRFQLWESAEQHRVFLQPDTEAFRWLCGLAVSVSPDFALTVAIGRKLGVEVSHDRLLRLTRIPWLSRNESDTRLRLELLALLTPEEERLARQAVAEELDAVRNSVEGSFAHIEWKTNLAIHRFALDPENPEHRQTLRDLMQVGLFSDSHLQEIKGFIKRRVLPPHLAGTNFDLEEFIFSDALLPVVPPISPTGMIFIRGGTFEMGCTSEQRDCYNDEKPTTRVTVSDFHLGKYEVTFDEYDAFCTATDREKPYDENWGRGQRPVINVSWFDAIAYCNWRSEREGLPKVYTISGDRITANWSANGYRLPTEAEWEYAARGGGKAVLFGNGKNIADPREINFAGSLAHKKEYSIAGEYRQETVPVGSLNSPNALGLHDMSGNVWEWCWDWKVDYPEGDHKNYRGPNKGFNRVLRGGSWAVLSQFIRVTSRNGTVPGDLYDSIGFRLAKLAASEKPDTSSGSVRIFIYYLHEDSAFFKELRNRFKPLEDAGEVKILAKERTEGVGLDVDEKRQQSDILLLLVSAAGVSRKDYFEEELLPVKKEMESGQLRLFPLLVNSCRWQDTILVNYQMIPANLLPITEWPDQSAAWAEVFRSLKALMTERVEPQVRLEQVTLSQALPMIDDIRQYITQGKLEDALIALRAAAQAVDAADILDEITVLEHRFQESQLKARLGTHAPDDLIREQNRIAGATLNLLKQLPNASPPPAAAPKGIREQAMKQHILLLTLGVKVWVVIWLFYQWESGGFSADQFAGTLTLLIPVMAAYTGLMFQDFLDHRHAHAGPAPASPRVHRRVQWTIYAVIIGYGIMLSAVIGAKTQGLMSYAQLSGVMTLIESGLGIYITSMVRSFFTKPK